MPSPNELENHPKRSAAAMKSPLKSDIYVGENEDIESTLSNAFAKSMMMKHCPGCLPCHGGTGPVGFLKTS